MTAPKLTEAQREMLDDATNGPIIANAFGRKIDDANTLRRAGLLSWVYDSIEPWTTRITDAGRAALRGDK